MFAQFCMIGTAITYAANICYAIYNYLGGNHSPETYETPYKISLPFDRSTYIGFIMTLFTNMAVTILLSLITLAVIGFFGAACYYIEGGILHFQNEISKINGMIQITKCNSKKSEEDLSNAIEFHIKLIEYKFLYFVIIQKKRFHIVVFFLLIYSDYMMRWPIS